MILNARISGELKNLRKRALSQRSISSAGIFSRGRQYCAKWSFSKAERYTSTIPGTSIGVQGEKTKFGAGILKCLTDGQCGIED